MPLFLDGCEGRYCFYPVTPSFFKDFQTSNAPSRVSFLHGYDHRQNSTRTDDSDASNDNPVSQIGVCCINIAKELIVYDQETCLVYDRRLFKTSPTCHSFKNKDSNISLLCGFSNGDICIIYPFSKEPSRFFNEDVSHKFFITLQKMIDKTSVTSISWVPRSPNHFLVSFASGNIYLFDELLNPIACPPFFESFKSTIGIDISVTKSKSSRNPLYKYTFSSRLLFSDQYRAPYDESNGNAPKNQISSTEDCQQKIQNDQGEINENSTTSFTPNSSIDNDCAINQLAFSPCGIYLALVTQNGYLFVVDYFSMELYGFMRSYFGGLTCLDWSPDGRFVVVGGQDDHITVWSMEERCVICRGQGHRSWVTGVRFDPILCPTSNQLSQSPNHQLLPSNKYSESTTRDTEINSGTEPINTIATLHTYRIGSVGQDTMLCLWNLTDDTIRQGHSFAQQSFTTTTTGFDNATTASHSSSSNASSSIDDAPSMSSKSSTLPPSSPNYQKSPEPTNLFGFFTLLKHRRRRSRRRHTSKAASAKQDTLQPKSGLLSRLRWSTGRSSRPATAELDDGVIAQSTTTRSSSSSNSLNDTADCSTTGTSFDRHHTGTDSSSHESGIYEALAMTLLGSNGETKTQLMNAMCLDKITEKEDIHKLIGQHSAEVFKSTEGVELSIANRLFAEVSYAIQQTYKSQLLSYYKAESEQVDFVHNAEKVRQHINQFIAELTKQKIKELLPGGSVDSLTKAVLTNAVYFKGLWENPFRKESTTDQDFYHLDGTNSAIRMMKTKTLLSTSFLESADTYMIKIPFKGSEWSMLIALPKEKLGLPKLLEYMHKSNDALGQMLKADFSFEQVLLFLPRFKLDANLDLPKLLQEIGIQNLFCPTSADLSGIAPGFFISDAVHSAVLEVDEEGATAAAATAMVCNARSAPPKPTVIKVDHPFVVALLYKEHLPAFIGHVVKPEGH